MLLPWPVWWRARALPGEPPRPVDVLLVTLDTTRADRLGCYGDSRGVDRRSQKHHTSSPAVWLVFYKAHTGVKSIHYEDTVREALCFGWIDSLIKRLDDDRYALKVTPRQPTSKWSDINRKRWAELKAAGLLTSAGLAAAPTTTPMRHDRWSPTYRSTSPKR